MVREANAIDFWRGFALVTIFINHIPGIYFERFTHRNISISDSAELFVFLAGWALRLLYNHLAVTQGVRYVLLRIASRALTIYAAHLMLICLAIAMLATAAYVYDNPLFLEWYNAAGVFYDPMRAHMGLVALTYQLGYFDILPLYVVLMAVVAPLTVILHGYVPRLLLPIAICLYVIIMVWQISLPTWPTDGHWFFNPLAWQLVFVLGFVLAGDGGLGGAIRRHMTAVRLVAWPIVIASAIVVVFELWPDPVNMPEPKLFFMSWKSFVTPPRLLQFLALVAAMSALFPYIRRIAPALVTFLSRLGRNSLPVFCVGSILSLAGQIVRFLYKGGLAADAAIVIVGIALMGLTALLAEWPKARVVSGRGRSTS